MKLSDIPKKIVTYIKEVRVEVKKVNWPTRQEALRYSLIVIGASFFVAAYLGLMDFALTSLLNNYILN